MVKCFCLEMSALELGYSEMSEVSDVIDLHLLD